MSNDAQNLAKLEKRLAELKAELDRQRQSLHAKQTTITIVFLILVIGVSGYLFFVSKKLNQLLDADSLVTLAIEQARPEIKSGISSLALQIKEQRTEVIRKASEFLRKDAPDMVFAHAKDTLQGVYKNELDKAEKQLNDVIDAGVVTAKETLKERGVDLTKPAEFDKSAEKIADIFAKESEKRIDDFYKKYTERSESFITILDRLGEGKDLTKRERNYRDVITGVLALLHKWEVDKPAPAAK